MELDGYSRRRQMVTGAAIGLAVVVVVVAVILLLGHAQSRYTTTLGGAPVSRVLTTWTVVEAPADFGAPLVAGVQP